VPYVNILFGITRRSMVFSWYCQRDLLINTMRNIMIRPIRDADVPSVARLLKVLACEFIVNESTPEGAATFLRENDESAIRRYIAIGHVYHVAESDGEIAGFIAVRDNNHLFHMFVGAQWQRQGICRRMWEVARAHAIAAGGSGEFTVNSSNFAVPVYEAMGFVRTAPTQSLKGLFYNPMVLAMNRPPR
jgi:GNAT superfamily N-acetyltransferase